MKSLLLIFSLSFVLFPGMCPPAFARVLLRIDEAITQNYPNCKVKEESVFLTPAQIKAAEENSGLKIESQLLNRKQIVCPSGNKTLYLDTHVVRTQKQVLMIVLGADQLEKVELLSFYEPSEYIPGKKWYQLFSGIKLSRSVTLGGNIPHISGASLTSRATASTVRKIIALHEALIHVKK